jgi:hypothetical protein
MSGLIFREILSTSGPANPLLLSEKPSFRAYNRLGRWTLRGNPGFRDALKATAENQRLKFLAERLCRTFDNSAADPPPARLLVQHTANSGLPQFDTQAAIDAYHASRSLVIYDEVDTPGSAKSILTLPDMSSGSAPAEGNVQYLLPLFFMTLKQIDPDDPEQKDMLRAYFGTMLAAKCR